MGTQNRGKSMKAEPPRILRVVKDDRLKFQRPVRRPLIDRAVDGAAVGQVVVKLCALVASFGVLALAGWALARLIRK